MEELDDIIQNQEKHVKEFDVPKRKGGKRHIIAPTARYKFILKGINWRILNAYKTHEAAHGFVKSRGVVTNAVQHVGTNAVGSIDLSNFFDTVSEEHLKNVLFGNKRICKLCKNFKGMCEGKCSPSLYKNRDNNYAHKCEEILASYVPNYEEKTGYQSLFKKFMSVAIYKDHTPQGFPTSPTLANIALRGMDKMIAEQCEEKGILYTRYADDLSFSTTDNDKIWLKDNTLGMATSIVRAFKFEVNKRKTKYTGRGGRMMVCGAVVNDKLSLPKWRVKKFRAEVHHATVKDVGNTTKTKIKELKGFASWLMSLNPVIGNRYMSQLIEFESKM